MLRLYYFPGACSLVSRIALEEAGADYEDVLVDFRTSQQTEAGYRAVNPKARVPALETERGVMTENVAILAYVAQRWPEAGLAPRADPWAFGQVQAFNSYLASTVHVAHAHYNRGYRWASDEAAIQHMRDRAPVAIAQAFQLIEDEMLQGPWVMGEAYSTCDPYLFVLFGWLPQRAVDPAQFPRLHEHHARMRERPAVRRALERDRREV